MKRFLCVSGGLALLLLSILLSILCTGPRPASAQDGVNATDTPTPVTTAVDSSCQSYLQNIARYLGVPTTTFEQSTFPAQVSTLTRLVKDGKLTPNEAAMLKQRLRAHRICDNKESTWREQNLLHLTLQKYQDTLYDQLAQNMHLNAKLLNFDLQNGLNLSEIAKAQSMPQSQMPTLFLNAIQSTLSQAQKDGNITQQQNDNLTQLLQQHPDLVKRWLYHRFRGIQAYN